MRWRRRKRSDRYTALTISPIIMSKGDEIGLSFHTEGREWMIFKGPVADRDALVTTVFQVMHMREEEE